MKDQKKITSPYIINSLSDYINEIVILTKKHEKGQKLWYRGHGSTEFDLIPSIYRVTLDNKPDRASMLLNSENISIVESGIDLSFNRQALTYLSRNRIPNTQMNRYFLKQHYKVKTRLLDWTESALVALFFAINDQSHLSKNGEVWVLLPFNLNSYTISKLHNDTTKNAKMIFSSVDEFEKKATLFNDNQELRINQLFRKYYYLDMEENEKMHPIAVYPPYLDDRMKAQQSCFTLFGNMYNGLREANVTDQILYSFKIPSGIKLQLLEELRWLGFNNFSIYPDLDGLGQSINEEYKYRFEQEALNDNREMLIHDLAKFASSV